MHLCLRRRMTHSLCFIICCFSVLGIVFFLPFDVQKGIIAYAILLLIFLAICQKNLKILFSITMVAFTIRSLVSILTTQFDLIPQFSGDPDFYHERSVYLLELIQFGFYFIDISEFPVFSSFETLFYQYVTVPIYVLSGSSLLVMKIVNSFFGTLGNIYVYLIAIRFFTKKSSLFIFTILAFVPSYILYSSQNFPDALLFLCSTVFLYNSILFFHTYKTKELVVLIGASLVSIFLRLPNIFIYISAFFIQFFKKKIKRSAIIVALLSLFSFFIFLNLFPYMVSLDFVESQREVHTRGNTSYLEYRKYNSLVDVALYAPIGIFYFLFTPFIWDSKTLPSVIFSIESFFFLILFLSIIIIPIRTLFRYAIDRRIILLLTFFLIGAFTYGIVESNTGAAIRHRIQFMYLLLFIIPVLIRTIVMKTLETTNVRTKGHNEAST